MHSLHVSFICLVFMSIFVAAITTESVECRDHLGVYYLVITLAADLTVYQVATFRSDNSFNTIDSLADGNLFSSNRSFGAYSNLNGAWQCNGSDQIIVNTLNFNYPTSKLPRYLSTAVFNLQFNATGDVTGTVAYEDYDLASTRHSDRSKWLKFAGPFQFDVQGYQLFQTSSA